MGKKKREWLERKVQPIVEALFFPYSPPEDRQLTLQHKGVLYKITVPYKQTEQTIDLNLKGDVIRLLVPPEKLPEVQDGLHTYSMNLLQVATDFMLFDQAIKSGHISLLTILMKRFIPLFVGLSSYKSKYAIECINFITKTECVLSDYESTRVKLGLLVNRKGKAGKNKPADMNQENNIKLVKNVIRGLGAGKTEKAMIRASKAAPAVSGLVSALDGSNKLKKQKLHNKKSIKDDVARLCECLRTLKPFNLQQGREMDSFKKMPGSILGAVSKEKLKDFIQSHSRRSVDRIL